MPFPNQEYALNYVTLLSLKEIGAVYGLFRPDPYRPGSYVCLYVGETDNLRRISPIQRQRKAREVQLIAEFNPVGNNRRGG
jgi:hypothetical protein